MKFTKYKNWVWQIAQNDWAPMDLWAQPYPLRSLQCPHPFQSSATAVASHPLSLGEQEVCVLGSGTCVIKFRLYHHQ